VKLILSIIA